MYKKVIYNNETYDDLEINEKGEMRNVRTGHEYSWWTTPKGYEYTIYRKGAKYEKQMLRHRLIAWNFIPLVAGKEQINHKDANKRNNSIENLEWCSCYENIQHSIKNKLQKFKSGEEKGVAKLTREQVKFIVDNYKSRDKTLGAKGLACRFNVRPHNIVDVVCGRTWVKFVKEYKKDKSNEKTIQ